MVWLRVYTLDYNITLMQDMLFLLLRNRPTGPIRGNVKQGHLSPFALRSVP